MNYYCVSNFMNDTIKAMHALAQFPLNLFIALLSLNIRLLFISGIICKCLGFEPGKWRTEFPNTVLFAILLKTSYRKYNIILNA